MNKPPLMDKATLNPEEAAVFYNLSRRKLFRLLQKQNLPFIMYYGKRKLIKKEEFEDYLRRRPGMREELKRGSPVNNRWGHRSAETRSTTEQTKPTVEAGTAVEGGEMNVIS